MRAIAFACVLAAVPAAGCLRSTAFRCIHDAECGPGATCEVVGYCSVPDTNCVGTGRSFSDSAGGDLASTCVPAAGPRPDAGVPAPDAAIDAPPDAPPAPRCPADYAPIAGSAHVYKALGNASWDQARRLCAAAGATAYLAIPDDATELAGLAALAAPPLWIGISRGAMDVFATVTGVPAVFLPWAPGEPDNTPPGQDCVDAVSTSQIASERCNGGEPAVCECEP